MRVLTIIARQRWRIAVAFMSMASHFVGWVKTSNWGWPRAAKQPKATICVTASLCREMLAVTNATESRVKAKSETARKNQT